MRRPSGKGKPLQLAGYQPGETLQGPEPGRARRPKRWRVFLGPNFGPKRIEIDRNSTSLDSTGVTR